MRRIVLFACLATGALVGLVVVSAASSVAEPYSTDNAEGVVRAQAPRGTPTITCPSWAIVGSPNANQNINELNAVTGTGSDIWAVGSYDLFGLGNYRTLTTHWDGSAWSLMPSPNPGSAHDYLFGATGSGNDVWAVGMYNNTGMPGQPLTLHWTGNAWSQVANPNLGNGILWGATGSGNDVWAVGYYGTPNQTLTMHWNGSTWSLVPSPNVGTDINRLYAVSGSGNNVWAVGIYYNSDHTIHTLTLHWDGNAWSVVPSADASPDWNWLNGVTGSDNDFWAVGSYRDPTDAYLPLILHWDGSAWSVVPGPNPDTDVNWLRAATGSGNDVWAVGYSGNPRQTLTLHWEGSAWSVVPSPNVGSGSNELDGVALGGNDVWGVGRFGSSTLTMYLTTSCTGGTPTPTPTQCVPTSSCFVPGATIVPGTVDIGNHCDDCITNVSLPFPFSMYGQTFTSVNLSSNGNAQLVSNNSEFANVCLPVSAMGPTIFAYWEDLVTEGTNCTGGCGIYTSVSGSAPNRIFNIEWRTFYFSNPGNAYFEIRLYENQATAAFEIILGELNTGATATIGVQNGVGQFTQCVCNTPPTPNSRIAFVSSCPTPSATPGGNTATATSTPTPSATRTPTGAPVTSTPVVTVTPCIITFSDVLPTDYFYEPVRYLYCRGVISGYSDNTFRPYNNTTRGQLTKIVVLAFGFPIYTPPTPTFTDVPENHTFYQYVETAAHEGLVSGYADGTFRPQNDVTRGQLSKIVVEAAGWPLLNPPVPTFSDVPSGSTFYQYIETAYDHGIISGYSDGTFRPGNNATRGQISKIVYEAIIQR